MSKVPAVANAPARSNLVLWRDPHSVSPEELARCIESLEKACAENPASADLRTCLGMALAMNFDVYKSMDALEAAVDLDPGHFYSRLKYAELHYRLRALIKAEQETRRALELANDPFEIALARQQLQEIRKLMRDGTQKPEWTKPLMRPAVCLAGLMLLFSLAVYFQ